MKTNAEIEKFVGSLQYCSMEEIKDFITAAKAPCADDTRATVLKHVEQMVLDCMEGVVSSSGWDDREMRKLNSLTEAANAVVNIEEALS